MSRSSGGVVEGGFLNVTASGLLIAARYRFGQPPDVGAIARWAAGLRQRFPDKDLRIREIEAMIRIVLGDYWLSETIDGDAWGELESEVMLVRVREHLASAGIPTDEFVAQAEAEAPSLASTERMAAFAQRLFIITEARQREVVSDGC